MKIKFRRPIYIGIVQEGMFTPDSIFVYAWQPHIIESRSLNDDEAKVKGYKFENVVLQYRKYILVDLWFVVITLKWKTKYLSESTTEITEQ